VTTVFSACVLVCVSVSPQAYFRNSKYSLKCLISSVYFSKLIVDTVLNVNLLIFILVADQSYNRAPQLIAQSTEMKMIITCWCVNSESLSNEIG